jgi:hypothetical protein
MNMAAKSQNYANHTRWHPPFHFFVLPVMLINVVWSIVDFLRNPGWHQGWWIVVSLALAMLTTMVRTNPLKAQDRIIRLEEQLRYLQLLQPEFAQQTRSLTSGQVTALRFASDEELEGLLLEVLAGRMSKPSDIKRAIKNWRSDTFRV